MKKLVLSIAFLVVTLLAQGQSNTIALLSSSPNISSPTTLSGGTSLVLSFNINLPSSSSCYQKVVFNSGSLLYSSSQVPAGASVSQDNSNIYNRTVTISNINSTASGILNFNITFSVPTGECFPAQSLTATLSTYDGTCAPSPAVFQSPTLTINNTDKLDTDLSQVEPTNTTNICAGTVVKYKYRIANPGNCLNYTNAKAFLQLSSCATVIGIYKENLDFNNPIALLPPSGSSPPNSQTISWNIYTNPSTPLPITIWSSPLTFYIYVKYPCNVCNSSPFFKPMTYATGQKPSSCGNNLTYQSPSHEFATSLSGANCTNCNGGGGSNIAVTPPTLLCPSACTVTNYMPATYNVSITPGSTYNSIIFIADVPSGFLINSITNAPSTACGATPVVEYLNSLGNYVPYAPSSTPLATTKVKWTYNCTIANAPLTLNFYISYRYNLLSPPSGQVPFYCHLYYDTVDTAHNSSNGVEYSTVGSCSQQLTGNKYIIRYNQDGSEVVNSSGAPIIFGSVNDASPGEVFSYRINVKNISNTGVSNVKILDDLSDKLVFLGPIKYTYTTVSNPNEASFTTLTGNTMNIPDMGAVAPLVTITNGPTSTQLKVENINFPSGNCVANKTLFIEFKVQAKNSLMAQTQIVNQAYVKNTNGTSLVGDSYLYTIMTIKSLFHLSNKMFVKCKKETTWLSDDSATLTDPPVPIIQKVRNGDKIDFKMLVYNDGSENMTLFDLLNLKPQPGDQFESDHTPRGSDGTTYINYFNTTGPPTITTNTSFVQTPVVSYNNDVINMLRDNLTTCPAGSGTSSPWLPGFGNSTNWMRINFSSTGHVLHPGDYVEVTYSAKVSGDTGTSYNSFIYNAKDNLGHCVVHSNARKLTILNDGEGCEPPCIDCASFGLIKGEKYLVSGWVKEESTRNPNKQFKTYIDSNISVYFKHENSNDLFDVPYIFTFRPTGDIIDGWQRIIGEITVPGSDTIRVGDMILELKNESRSEKVISYFDDVRVLPTKGNMKSFVYDQKTQRLMAELDENNYSTFYEYDLEGGLIRIKKETEKGVFTIQETRSGNVKVGGK
jgi:uncharacterized repeat protein (TIGR01451 family)